MAKQSGTGRTNAGSPGVTLRQFSDSERVVITRWFGEDADMPMPPCQRLRGLAPHEYRHSPLQSVSAADRLSSLPGRSIYPLLDSTETHSRPQTTGLPYRPIHGLPAVFSSALFSKEVPCIASLSSCRLCFRFCPTFPLRFQRISSRGAFGSL